ncbi:MAG: GDSL-type esterase/lipase family protein, partial [Acidobacteriota bacterium]
RHGGEIWQDYYGQRNAFNLGVAGDTTVHVLWRLQNSDLGRLASPKVAVVNIGTNNGGVHSVEETVLGIQEIVETLRQELPQAKVLLLAIFPRGETADDPGRKFNAEVSRRSAQIADGETVHFLDIGSGFLAEDGTISAEVMPDFLHLTEKGYAIWARGMEPKLKELLGE